MTWRAEAFPGSFSYETVEGVPGIDEFHHDINTFRLVSAGGTWVLPYAGDATRRFQVANRGYDGSRRPETII